MKITSIEVYSSNQSNLLTFSLDPNDVDSQYQVRGITGLDADEIVQSYYAQGLTGGKFYEYALKPREIAIAAVTNPRMELDESYSDVRDRLYRAISATRSGLLTLNFKSGGSIVATLMGYITKFEVPYFEKRPAIQITLKCNDPLFRGVAPVEIPLVDNSAANLSIPDSISTAPHGFTMKFHFSGTSSEIELRDPEHTWEFVVHHTTGFLIDDIIEFSSEYDNRYVKMTRSGVTTNLADMIEPQSVWPIIFPGANEFDFLQSNYVHWNEPARYYPAFWGV